MPTFFKNLLWTLPFLSFIGGYLLLDSLYHPKEIETPALVGKSIEQALAILSEHNLNVRLLTYKEDETLAQGTIVSQTPCQTQKIKPNQSVFLIVSTKPKKIKAPNLLGLSINDIDPITKKNKIHVQSFYIQSNYPQNQCFAQQPMPGQDLVDDTMLIYLCTPKSNMVLIPHLKDKPLATVLEFLKTHNVTYEITHTSLSSLNHECNNCIVSDQRPLSGSIVTMSEEKPLHMQLQASFNE